MSPIFLQIYRYPSLIQTIKKRTMKSHPFLTPLFWAPVFILVACNQPTQPAGSSSSTENPDKIKPEVILYVTGVDKLNLRELPSKDGKIIAQLAEGMFVTGTGEKSPNKEEATLRGIPYNEPYIRVSAPGAGQAAGWVYGGALIPVYAGSIAGIPDTGQILLLTKFLKPLNTKKLDSGKQAWDFTENTFGKSSGATADAAFILFEHFFRRLEVEGEFYTLTEKISWTEDDYRAISADRFDMTKSPVTRLLQENGFRLEEGAGMVFPVVDWRKLQTFFGPKSTPAMKVYIDQETAEQIEKPWDDGGIIISLDKLADRAAFWEKFNLDHPYFPLAAETKESERWMRLVLVTGADNTPTHDYETRAITEDFKNVWNYILHKYPGTKLAKTAKEITDLCAAEGWKRTKKVEEWQMKYAEGN